MANVLDLEMAGESGGVEDERGGDWKSASRMERWGFHPGRILDFGRGISAEGYDQRLSTN